MSRFVYDGRDKNASRLVRSFEKMLDGYSIEPNGVWGSQAKVICNGATINSKELDMEIIVPFDDDLEPNEAEVIIYNLTNSTAKKFKNKAKISIEAGYEGDTGVIFEGYVSKVQTQYSGADKATVIKALDDVSKKTVSNVTFKKGRKASYILKYFLDKTKTPIAVFKVQRDHTYKDSVTEDGELMPIIKKYAQVCGISVYVKKGKIYARSLKEGDALNFTISEETGMIGSPMPFEEEILAADYKDTIKGYEVETLLQHRMSAGGIVKLKSLVANGTFRIKSGQHVFNESEAVTRIKIY